MIKTSSIALVVLAEQNPKLVETLLGFLPIALFLLILYFIVRKLQRSPAAKVQHEYLQQQVEMMPRIEALLERIAKALERDR